MPGKMIPDWILVLHCTLQDFARRAIGGSDAGRLYTARVPDRHPSCGIRYFCVMGLKCRGRFLPPYRFHQTAVFED